MAWGSSWPRTGVNSSIARWALGSAIATELIGLHEPHLREAHIRCLFSLEGKKARGKDLYAWTKKVDAVGNYLSGTPREDKLDVDEHDGIDFVVLVDHARWEMLEENDRRRVVHHELMRMDGEPGEWRLTEYDFAGFRAELRLYGPWRNDLKGMANTLKQQELPLEVAR